MIYGKSFKKTLAVQLVVGLICFAVIMPILASPTASDVAEQPGSKMSESLRSMSASNLMQKLGIDMPESTIRSKREIGDSDGQGEHENEHEHHHHDGEDGQDGQDGVDDDEHHDHGHHGGYGYRGGWFGHRR